ncbi:PspC domain-containing protein [Demequina aurantiaca]|uniref:PspC domain-containing protein n=1 Tax=Demequina aurantiaca TaxID=676200 RepID=UPI0007814791|nr:PspC domain-containing protein [Demequina aurantiaca]
MTDSAPQPQREAAFFSAIRSWGITRSSQGVFGGVASGVGERIGLARVPARIILVIAAIILTGLVLLAYAAAWALLPDRDGNIVIQNFGRGITNVGALVGIGIIALIGIMNLDGHWWNGGFNIGWDSADVSGFGRFDTVLMVFFTIISIGFSLLVLAGIAFGIVYLVRRGGRDSGQGSGGTSSGHAGTDATSVDANDPPAAAAGPPAAADPTRPQPWEAALTPRDVALGAASTGAAAASAGDGPESADAAATSSGEGSAASVPPVPPVPPRPALPPRPPKRRVPGPGKMFYLITLAWVLISGAAILIAESQYLLAASASLIWLATFTIGFGVILAGISLTGRKPGFLGFLSVPLLAVGLLAAVNTGEIRDAFDMVSVEISAGGSSDYWIDGRHYDSDGNLIEEVPYDDPSVADPTLAFTDDYQQIFVAQQCWDYEAYRQEMEFDPETGESYEDGRQYATQARMTYGALDQDAVVDVTAERTLLTIPQGTNLILRGDAFAQATVDWQSRGLHCEFYDDGSFGDGSQRNTGTEYLSAINAGAPTLTLVVHDDKFANTIVIEETPAVTPDATATPAPTGSPEPTSAPEGNQS